MRRGHLPAVAALVAMASLPVSTHAEGMGRLGVGDRAADFGLPSIEPGSGELGKTHWLSDYVGPAARTPKRALLLVFYATWCKACIEELPRLSRLQQEYRGAGLQVLGVNVRAPGENARGAQATSHRLIREHGLSFPLLLDRFTRRSATLYAGDKATLPCHVVVGRDGTIVERRQGKRAAQVGVLRRTLERLLGKGAGPPPAPRAAGALP